MGEFVRGTGPDPLPGFDIGHDLPRHVHDDERIEVDISLLADLIGFLFVDRLKSANARGHPARAHRQKGEADEDV